MKNPNIKKYLPRLKGLVKSVGGPKSLKNPMVVSLIIDELVWFYRDIEDSELDSCRKYLNKLKKYPK